MIRTYKDAGVDVARGERFADHIRNIRSPAVLSSLGSFAGGIDLPTHRMSEPVLLTAADGVGTKILVAQRLEVYDSVGIDLVAMSVNDLLVCGARPLVFLDYIACGAMDEKVLHPIMDGVVRGCELALCTLAGGETAEMPDVYGPDEFDLAGFAAGIAEKSRVLPRWRDDETEGVVFGLPSSGIHSNGLSLARKVAGDADRGMLEQLLTPTRIYAREMAVLTESDDLMAAAHVTGGGLEGNLGRVVPEGSTIALTYEWPRHDVFDEIRNRGGISEAEMRRTYNLGIGIALVVRRSGAERFRRLADTHSIELLEIGRCRSEA